jgi:hypothetical protein
MGIEPREGEEIVNYFLNIEERVQRIAHGKALDEDWLRAYLKDFGEVLRATIDGLDQADFGVKKDCLKDFYFMVIATNYVNGKEEEKFDEIKSEIYEKMKDTAARLRKHGFTPSVE